MRKNNYIKIAKKAAKIQILELKKINKVFNKTFVKAVDLIANCKGKVICAGIGKSGLIARKVSATLSSVGVSSFFLNPGEANHGDLGQIDKRDILLVFSYSGNTSEIMNMLKYANRFNIKVIGVASKSDSILIKASDIKILLPKVIEATMGFKYVGNTLQTMQGKHFDLPWLEGTENTVKNGIPHRKDPYNKALDLAGVDTAMQAPMDQRKKPTVN